MIIAKVFAALLCMLLCSCIKVDGHEVWNKFQEEATKIITASGFTAKSREEVAKGIANIIVNALKQIDREGNVYYPGDWGYNDWGGFGCFGQGVIKNFQTLELIDKGSEMIFQDNNQEKVRIYFKFGELGVSYLVYGAQFGVPLFSSRLTMTIKPDNEFELIAEIPPTNDLPNRLSSGDYIVKIVGFNILKLPPKECNTESNCGVANWYCCYAIGFRNEKKAIKNAEKEIMSYLNSISPATEKALIVFDIKPKPKKTQGDETTQGKKQKKQKKPKKEKSQKWYQEMNAKFNEHCGPDAGKPKDGNGSHSP